MRLAIYLLFIISICACTPLDFDRNYGLLKRDPIDREGDLTRTDFKEGLRIYKEKSEHEDETLEAKDIELPFHDLIFAPESPNIANCNSVSLSCYFSSVIIEVHTHNNLVEGHVNEYYHISLEHTIM